MTPLIQINKFNKDKQSLEKKNWWFWWKITDVYGLVTTAVKNTIWIVTNLVKETEFDTKILEFEGKYINSPNYNKFRSDYLMRN